MQKHVVLTWELGAGYGHVMRFIPLIEALLNKNYKVSLLARNTVTAGNLTRHLPIQVIQAPIYVSDGVKPQEISLSYGDIVYNLGYAEPNDLLSLTQAWANLFELLKPDLIIADHSPTAIIAAKCLSIKALTYGTGFCIPPNTFPLTLFKEVDAENKKLFVEREKSLLNNINYVFEFFGTQAINQVSELFLYSTNFICTLPELDHYASTRELLNSEYNVPRFDLEEGLKINFSNTTNKRIFAYIKERSPGFTSLMEALKSSPHECILHIPNPSPALLASAKSNSNIKIYSQPIKIADMLIEADLIICHAGHGLVSASLLAAKPLLLVPSQLEQNILTRSLAQQKLAAAINMNNKNVDCRAGIEFALHNIVLKQNVQKFSEKYMHLSTKTTSFAIIDKCEDLLL